MPGWVGCKGQHAGSVERGSPCWELVCGSVGGQGDAEPYTDWEPDGDRVGERDCARRPDGAFVADRVVPGDGDGVRGYKVGVGYEPGRVGFGGSDEKPPVFCEYWRVGGKLERVLLC